MSELVRLIVVITAIACMALAQRKAAPRSARFQYSLMGSATSLLVATDAVTRGDTGTALLFAAAAACSLIALVRDYLKDA